MQTHRLLVNKKLILYFANNELSIFINNKGTDVKLLINQNPYFGTNIIKMFNISD